MPAGLTYTLANLQTDIQNYTEVGSNVFTEAVMNKLAPGNYGLCEGNCICGTCHIYVTEEDFKKLEKAEENEVETLETSNIELTKCSRLSCQIELKKEYDNNTITIPPEGP